MGNYITLIYPVIIIGILLFGVKIAKRGSFAEEAWSRSQSKCMQAVAALMIILHHCVQTVTDYGDINKGPITLWNSIGILFTSIFFFFSGFGLYCSYRNKEGYLDGFIKKHLSKLLVPFFITNIIYLLIMAVGRVTTAFDVFSSILGFTLMNTNAWFLVELIFLYIAFYVIFKKAADDKKALKYMTVFTIVLTLFSMLLCHDRSRVNGHWFMGEWWYNTTLTFVMGMYFAKYETNIKDFMKRRYPLLLSLSGILLVVWYVLEEYVNEIFGYYQEWVHHPGYGSKLLTLVVQLILCAVFLVVLLLINLKLTYGNKVLVSLGGVSLEIYLIHDIFRWIAYTVDKMPDAEYIGIVYVFSIIAAYLLSLINKAAGDFVSSHHDKIFTLKRLTIDPELCYEAKQALKKLHIAITILKGFAIFVVAGFIVTGIYEVYDVAFGVSRKSKESIATMEGAQIGDTVYFGNWILDYQKGEAEPVPWTVYDIKDGHMLLISDMVLGNVSYHDYHDTIDWKGSRLCRMLNHDFYYEAFTEDERGVLSGRYDNDLGWCESDEEAFDYFINKTGKDDFEDVIVKRELVFIPTKDEIEQYMPSEEDRIVTSSKAAQVQGVGTINSGYRAPYWLEDAGTGELSAMYVDVDGSINEKGKTINNTGMGVRPAVWIDMN